ncbi:hypothetical protein [Mycolicibacterium brumae]|uniref:Uncharacterized protein n=1 Tax=Mycolicibacterium brumae TaxID=85968 RepID=A0A2G5PF56_9MYCO|nr:hypothetical protein [Mycolicibacterium brumae]MCV7192059.1 hypothetical protein [Mycolicibacterium brumae]PIB76740.1 hypothetical protein CQY22_003565 [Mycolicibacterium brumae]RWA20726.1 hypothetical protein MBRU_03440 [Mycolicibacterium brumae DSM 44177]UWW07824.1 hypothetical protein L2Z93_000857 [Mycolicibacterium brumae]
MTGFEVLGIAAIVAVGAIAIVGIFLGLANWVGGFHMVHCRTCHHLTGSAQQGPVEDCVHCRHPALLHPLYAAMHRAAPIRIRRDPLHY